MKSAKYSAINELVEIYAKILGCEAKVLRKYCWKDYDENISIYKDGHQHQCNFPSRNSQRGNSTDDIYWGLHQVALRIFGGKSEETNQQQDENRIAWHVDDNDIRSKQPLTFLPFGYEENNYGGGYVPNSDLMVFEHSKGGKCYWLKMDFGKGMEACPDYSSLTQLGFLDLPWTKTTPEPGSRHVTVTKVPCFGRSSVCCFVDCLHHILVQTISPWFSSARNATSFIMVLCWSNVGINFCLEDVQYVLVPIVLHQHETRGYNQRTRLDWDTLGNMFSNSSLESKKKADQNPTSITDKQEEVHHQQLTNSESAQADESAPYFHKILSADCPHLIGDLSMRPKILSNRGTEHTQ